MQQFKSLIKEELDLNKDETLKKFQEKLITTKYEILGVKLDVDKKISKKIAKEGIDEIKEYLDKPSFSYLDEIYIYGYVISYAKLEIEEKKQYFKSWLKHVDNWACCDCVCQSFKDVNKHLEEYFPFAIELIKDEDEYTRRFGIIMLLSYYLKEEYIDKVLNIIINIKDNRYYIKMAISWLVATALAKEWNKTIKIIEENKLEKWTHNKSIRKAIESYRVSDEHKEYLRRYVVR